MIGVEEAYGDARLTGLNLLSVAHMALGDLGRVARVVKVSAWSTPSRTSPAIRT